MKYCQKCVMPDTKPDLYINEKGICSACLYFDERRKIDWPKREKQLISILEKHKKKSKSGWDCVVPVSGGKDSHYQVIKMLEYGMTPLCVVSTTCDLSEIGKKNINNLKNLGVDLIEFSPNPVVRQKLNKMGLVEVGDISWPEHVGIFTIPINIAIKFGIHLIVWGENSQNEYGGPKNASDNIYLDRRWLEEFGGLLGFRVSDLIGREGLTEKQLLPYIYPSKSELSKAKIESIFLGYFLPWDGYTNALIAQAYGFTTLSRVVEGSMVNYENLDNHQTGIHDYFKFLKFGFGRATDIACLHLRRGRLTRDEAISIVQKLDGKFPWTCLEKPLDKILERIGVTSQEFIKICDKFTNKKIFARDKNGNLIKNEKGELTKLYNP